MVRFWQVTCFSVLVLKELVVLSYNTCEGNCLVWWSLPPCWGSTEELFGRHFYTAAHKDGQSASETRSCCQEVPALGTETAPQQDEQIDPHLSFQSSIMPNKQSGGGLLSREQLQDSPYLVWLHSLTAISLPHCEACHLQHRLETVVGTIRTKVYKN